MAVSARIGLIGCGRWGRNILRDLLSVGCEVSVAEHSQDGRAHAREAGASDTCANIADMDQDLDGYIVAVQTDRHYSVLRQLAETGKPVFVEKPMVPDMARAKEIRELMGERLFVMHKWRYHPGVEALARLRTEGRFGAAAEYLDAAALVEPKNLARVAFWSVLGVRALVRGDR